MKRIFTGRYLLLLTMPMLGLFGWIIGVRTGFLSNVPEAISDDAPRLHLISDLTATVVPPARFTGVLTGNPAQEIFHVSITGKAGPHTKQTLYWSVYAGGTQLVQPQRVEAVADGEGAIAVRDLPFALFSGSDGSVKSVHGRAGPTASIQVWVGESPGHCTASDAIGSNQLAVAGTWLAAPNRTNRGTLHTLTLFVTNPAAIMKPVGRDDPIPQVLEFTVNVTGTPNTMASNLRWSLIEEHSFGAPTVLVTEREFSVLVDATGRGSYHGRCLVFATANGEVAGNDFSTGRARKNYVRVRVRNGLENPRHAALSQTFRMTSK